MNNIPQFLIEMLKNQYEEETVKTILSGYDVNRKLTLRVNSLKTNINLIKDKLDKTNINCDTVNFYENALVINNSTEKEIREFEFYKNGEVYLQSLSSMLPPIILSPKENMDILDMCAAPGGKTTELAALTNNNANITACEMNHIRLERLKYNIEKQMATSVYTMQIDARKIDDFFSFDSILLDAPCSGSGTLNSRVENRFTEKLIEKSILSQTQLLNKAIKILKSGGEIVYSTCSILPCENEDIVNSILKVNNVEIVPIEFYWLKDLPILPTKINGTICVCPNELYEGFFIAKLRKK